jgi:putative transposase
VEAGLTATEAARKYGVAEHAIYRWKAKFGGMEVNEAKRLRDLEDENRRLKQLVADLTLDNHALKAVVQQNGEPGEEEGGRGRSQPPPAHLVLRRFM